MGKEINRLKRTAKGIDVNVDAVISEMADEVIKRLPPPIDEKALVENVAITVEARVGAKLSEVLDALKVSKDSGKIDTELIVKAVTAQLQPQVVEATKRANDAVIQVNDAVAQVNQFLEKVEQAGQAKSSNNSDSANKTGLSLTDLADVAVKVAEAFAKFRPQPTITLADEWSRMYRGYKLFEDLRKADVDVETFDKKVHETFPKKP